MVLLFTDSIEHFTFLICHTIFSNSKKKKKEDIFINIPYILRLFKSITCIFDFIKNGLRNFISVAIQTKDESILNFDYYWFIKIVRKPLDNFANSLSWFTKVYSRHFLKKK